MYPNIFKLSNLDISELEKDELIKSISQYDMDILESICLEFNMFDFTDETFISDIDLNEFSNFILEKYRYTNFKNLLKISDFLYLDTIFHVHLKIIYHRHTDNYITNIYNIYNYDNSYVNCLYDIIHKGIKLKNIPEKSTKYWEETYDYDYDDGNYEFYCSKNISELEYLENPSNKYYVGEIKKFSCDKNELLKLINNKNKELCLIEKNNKYSEYDLSQTNILPDNKIFSFILDRCFKLKNVDYLNNLIKNNEILFSNSFCSSIMKKLDLVFFENLLKSNGAFSSQEGIIECLVKEIIFGSLSDHDKNLIKIYIKYKRFNSVIKFYYIQNEDLYKFLDSCKIFYIKGTECRTLFATDYNILRIVSGMACSSYNN